MDPRVATSILYLDGVSVSFDGFKALNNLSLAVENGEMRAIIGPNGAGKTTMMDVITGKTRPDTGDVLFDGNADLTKLDETQIAELGIGRKFQKPTVFEMHTVEDNILLALKADRSVRGTLFWTETAEAESRVNSILEIVRLTQVRERVAGSLSHGQKQWLEIGMLLAQDPKLLLVDERGLFDVDLELLGWRGHDVGGDGRARRRIGVGARVDEHAAWQQPDEVTGIDPVGVRDLRVVRPDLGPLPRIVEVVERDVP
mgnify:CR=1 FL=1